jgi:predicted SprT family Zn-dependent metalloprotease
MKFLFLFGITALLLGLWTWARLDAMVAHKDVAPIAQIRLQEDFQHLNDGYFDGNLNPTKVFYKNSPDGEDNMGETYCTFTLGLTTTCSIYINPKYTNAPIVAEEVLLHETCHVATWPQGMDHGEVWQICMLNLAKAGAFRWVW